MRLMIAAPDRPPFFLKNTLRWFGPAGGLRFFGPVFFSWRACTSMYYLNHGYMSKPSMKHIQLWFNSTQSGIERWSTSFWSLGGHLCYWMIRSKHFIGGLYSVFGKMRTFTIPFQWTRHIPLVREAFPFTKCVHRWALAGLAKYVRSKQPPFASFDSRPERFLGRILMGSGPFLAQF